MTYQVDFDSRAQSSDRLQPSVTARIGHFLHQTILRGLAHYRSNREHRIARAAFQRLRFLDDEILDDIGVTRANVEWANKLPLNVSAALELQKTKKRARPKIRP